MNSKIILGTALIGILGIPLGLASSPGSPIFSSFQHKGEVAEVSWFLLSIVVTLGY